MKLEKRIQQELVPEPQNIKASLRKVLLFIFVVTALAAIYQILMFNIVLPRREIHWQAGSLEQVKAFDEQGRRFAVLVMLSDDVGGSTQPLTVFDEPGVREEFNRLRLMPVLLPIDPADAQQQAWFLEQSITKLPAVMLYVSGRQQPVVLSADQLSPDSLKKILNDIRFQRYEP